MGMGGCRGDRGWREGGDRHQTTGGCFNLGRCRADLGDVQCYAASHDHPPPPYWHLAQRPPLTGSVKVFGGPTFVPLMETGDG